MDQNYLVLLVFSLNLSLNLYRQAEEIDKSCRISLIVNVVLSEGCDFLRVERIITPYTCFNNVTLVELKTNLTGYRLLSLINECRKSLAQRGEPLTVVYKISKGYGKLCFLMLTK